ncbi:MAG: phosphatase PAP2 family protein [Candidatus Paceibacterota bacterium]
MNNFIFFSLHNLANQNSLFDSVIIFLANMLPYLVLLFTLIFLIVHHDVSLRYAGFMQVVNKFKETFFAFIIGLSALVASEILKSIFFILRPFNNYPEVSNLFYATGYAFPSGHATFFMALAFSIYFLHKKVGMLLIFCAILIGTARVMAGVHYPVDILGGYVLGIIIATFFNYLYKRENK